MHGALRRPIRTPGFEVFGPCAYDDAGDLFLFGGTTSGIYLLKFNTASGTFTTITINKSINFYDIAWDGKYVAINGGALDSPEINRRRGFWLEGYGRQHSASKRHHNSGGYFKLAGRRYVHRAAYTERKRQVEA